MNVKSILTASAFAMVMPFAATAATVSGDFSDSGTNVLTGEGVVGDSIIEDLEADGGSVSFDFSVDPAPSSVSGIGNVRRASTVTGLVVSFAGEELDLVSGEDSFGFSFGPFGLFAESEIATLEFAWDGAAPTDSIDFDIELAPIPVPAAGLMLLSALGGSAFVARRKKKAKS